ncbi:DEAD/DEAH box helicase [Rhizoctonia solani]|uniref:DEAD/DEAH box helicase n=1 Tax=Rhizoctonia solani TaxID=456999 RepID=A0A8H8NPN9_9AGAM|nr:DEAD/DEAH box helicase [Rhizoctonia solani]QRW17015.1 DEAD/DEAH box helicase [Rhizoctonia solani]
MPPKRKRNSGATTDSGPSKPPNQRTSNPAPKAQSKGKVVAKKSEESNWPTFFQDLFKVYKKALAITFSLVRQSVENILKRPLELERVAQIKKDGTPDIYAPQNFSGDSSEEEHVLVLDFAESRKVKGSQRGSQGSGLILPVALTPAGVKNLIEKRNDRFCAAVNELIAACAVTSEDPVALVTSAAHDHIPINPASILESTISGSSEALTIPSSSERPSIESVIKSFKDFHEARPYREQIVYERVFDKREARWGELARPISNNVANALKMARGVTGFYSHQAAAINSIWDKRTSLYPQALLQERVLFIRYMAQPETAYHTCDELVLISKVPILCALEKDKTATAMFIYPTKALAQDQKGAIEQLLLRCPGLEDIKVATYDGDTPQALRNTVRQTASIIFTNFDMLHASIIPNEEHWRRFLKNLHLVVVDELHYYTGAFGSHAAMIMRRLRRVCAANGNQNIRYISCSATITNPRQHMADIFGIEDVEVITDDGAPAGQKHFVLWNPPHIDPLNPSAGKGVRTIVFCKVRRTYILAKVRASRRILAKRSTKIEHEAFSGNLLGLVATNALELGVDIGTLDAVIVLGFPFGLASLRQQMGRAGRRARDALTVLVADSRAIDQHYVNHPDELFSTLKRDGDGWYHTNPKFLPFPSKYISIRGIEEEKYVVIDTTLHSEGQVKILEEIEVSRAIFELYEGGVFMHQGQTYIVTQVSHDEKQARIFRSDVNWTTRPRDFTDINAIQTHRIRAVFGFLKLRGQEILDIVDIQTPPYERTTTGMWMDVPKFILQLLKDKGISPAEAIHAASHAVLNRTHLSSDLKTECKVPSKEYANGIPQKTPCPVIYLSFLEFS